MTRETHPNDPQVPDYLRADLQRMMLRVAGNEHWYQQQWLGVPLWQLPDDVLRLQQTVWEVKPKWIIETGTKYGGSAIFFASLMNLYQQNSGGVITIDIELGEEAKANIDTHPCGKAIKAMLFGDAASQAIANQVQRIVNSDPGTALVFLDDNHNAAHVEQELELYAPLVDIGSYIIVADTVFADLVGTPVGTPTEKYPDIANSNPRVAVQNFLAKHNNFEQDLRFINQGLGNFTDGFLKRIA